MQTTLPNALAAPEERGSPAAATYSVQTLGGFAVTAGDRPMPIPTNVPAQALKVLAVHGAIHVDALVEMLWHECAPGSGRTRLRNVLARLRRLYGHDFVVRTGEAVALGGHVVVDASRFEAAARAALAVRDTAARSKAVRGALAQCGGELLPYDRYRDWTDGPRERLRRLELQLIDHLIDFSVAEDQLEAAIHLIEEAIDRDPDVEDRYLLAADLLLRKGLRGRATLMLRRARSVYERLGVPLPVDHSALGLDWVS